MCSGVLYVHHHELIPGLLVPVISYARPFRCTVLALTHSLRKIQAQGNSNLHCHQRFSNIVFKVKETDKCKGKTPGKIKGSTHADKKVNLVSVFKFLPNILYTSVKFGNIKRKV
jgi:hypothetical protein